MSIVAGLLTELLQTHQLRITHEENISVVATPMPGVGGKQLWTVIDLSDREPLMLDASWENSLLSLKDLIEHPEQKAIR